MAHPPHETRFDRLRVLVHATSVGAESAVAAAIAATLRDERPVVLGLATGRTQVGVYRELVGRHARGEVSFRRATTFNLDEYWPLAPTHRGSFRRFMEERLFAHVDLPSGRGHVPDGEAEDAAVECARYESLLAAAGGVDLQLLGVGRNGHLGFNEPGSARTSRTRLVPLTASTRDANRADFAPDAVPERALTMGLGTILEARRIVALAVGDGKAESIERALRTPVTEEVPASLLRTHPDATLHLDAAAAARVL